MTEHPAWYDLTGRSVLVTGGAGFIGSHLVQRLLRLGAKVTVLDDFSSGHWKNLESCVGDLKVVKADIRDRSALQRATRGCEFVFHLAALVSMERSVTDPVSTYEVNVGGTVLLLLAAREARCESVVLASSSAVYGDTQEVPVSEERPVAPSSPYGASKLAAEAFGQAFASAYGMRIVALRYFNVYGPRQDPKSPYAAVIPRFIAALASGEKPVIYGDGEQTRDFVYVEDVVEANLRAAVVPQAGGQVINIATGKAHTIYELLEQLQQLCGRATPTVHHPERPGDIRHSQADITRARQLLGFTPSVSFREGLVRTLSWWGLRVS